MLIKKYLEKITNLDTEIYKQQKDIESLKKEQENIEKKQDKLLKTKEKLIDQAKGKTIEVNIYDLCETIHEKNTRYSLSYFETRIPTYFWPFKYQNSIEQIKEKHIKLYKENNDNLKISFEVATGISCFNDHEFFIFEYPIHEVKLGNNKNLTDFLEYDEESDTMYIPKNLNKELIIKLHYNDKNFQNDLFKNAFINYIDSQTQKTNGDEC